MCNKHGDKRFSILAAARSTFHLNLLEAAYIKTRRSVLRRQKEFVYTHKLLIIMAFLFGLLLRFLQHFASAIICFSWFPNVQINHIKQLHTLECRSVVLNLFLPMDPFSLLFFLVDPFIAIGYKNNFLFTNINFKVLSKK